jgi:trimeric autotransporter adhesin
MKHVTFHLPSFLRRVRIHGGEFDSSARAMNRVSEKGSLMTYEKAVLVQAELRIVRGSTNERKHMSTKTTFRRVALVAVAALGLGVLSVAPQASAAATAVTTTVSTTSATLLGTVDAPFASGSAIALNVTASFGTAMVSGDTATITYAVYNPKGETITGVTLVETINLSLTSR